jgi:hypothetical protein
MQPDRHDKRARIEAAGGWVVFNEGWRVGGILAMSHAIGMYISTHSTTRLISSNIIHAKYI